MTKYIVITGGVISGVGKGVATASIGRILKENGFSVTAIKIDPYINCDAGTMRPTEHGEVWVTGDGGEIDQDLGNYERFLEQPIPKRNNITTGQIYKTLIEKERRGDFLGETVQFIPHVPDEIKNRIKEASAGFDLALIEIGGTVGDYENIPFLFAMKSLENEIGKINICYALVTYLPVPSHISEMKTKPTQLAIKLLREEGIQPDFILCRGKQALDEPRKRKIEQYSNILSDHIISMPDVTGDNTPNTLYVIPLDLEKEKLGDKLMKILGLNPKKTPDWSEWKSAVNRLVNPKKEISVGIVGKYLKIGDFQLIDSYISIHEAIKHASSKNDVKVNLVWINAPELEEPKANISRILSGIKGIIIPGGFGSSGVEGKIKAITYCRENHVPFLGLCYGLQLAVIEFARNVCGLNGAHTTEIDPHTKYPVIDLLPEQENIMEKGGTMRLGEYPAILTENSRVRELYHNVGEISERHRHRYEVNPLFHQILQEKGLVFSGMSPNGKLVEFIELPQHKFFIGTQAHPEFKSSLLHPAPLFDGFVESCLK
ncbi:CTP synthase [Candidatus Woesearchaeota archaeon]|nr:CTP synthase [Candidatus Woesearchaeota archaeon]